jgi:hypothetical protein
VLWRLLYNRGRGVRNGYADDLFDDRYRSEKAHAWDVHDAAVRTHKVVTEAVESRRAYVRRFNGKKPLTREERVVYSRFFDTQAADRNTNGVDELLAVLEATRIEVSLHAAAKAQAAQKEKLVRQFDGDEWKLDPVLFAKVDERFGRHSIGRLASALNKLLPQ